MKKILIGIIFTFILFITYNVNAGGAIKGNVNFKTGEKIYHFPGCDSYNDTIIDTRFGERYFNTEKEAIRAGWRKAYNCPAYYKNTYYIGQKSCDKKYPGTIYREKDDKCVCENGRSYSKEYGCDVSRNAFIDKKETSKGQQSCNIKYPGTIYREKDDKCVCENGMEYSIWKDCKGGNKVIPLSKNKGTGNRPRKYIKSTDELIEGVNYFPDKFNYYIADFLFEKETGLLNKNHPQQKTCDKKYPGTVYREIDDKCVCANGTEYSIFKSCGKSYSTNNNCKYSDGSIANEGAVSKQGNTCVKGDWIKINKINNCKYNDGRIGNVGSRTTDGYICNEKLEWEKDVIRELLGICTYANGGEAQDGEISKDGKTCVKGIWLELPKINNCKYSNGTFGKYLDKTSDGYICNEKLEWEEDTIGKILGDYK